MRYVTYNASGELTGCYLQDLHPSHKAVYFPVSDDIANWPAYRMNAARDGIEVAPALPPVVTVPQAVPMLNLQLAMIEAGWADDFDNHVQKLPGKEGKKSKVFWAKGQYVRRDHPLVHGMPAALAKTEAEVDALFIAAGALNV